MSLHVSVDFGTSSTCTVVSCGGGAPQVVVIDGQPLIPSAVFAAADGTLFVGQEAERQAAVDPARFEPHPKRRIDEGELLLGSRVLKVGDVVRSVLHRAVGEARRYAGGAGVDLLVLTHPAGWGATRAAVLRQAAAGLSKELVLVPEPVAAAVFHSAGHGLPDGGALAVLDLGGGTVDASVVRKSGRTFEVLATRGEPNFGGADVDQILLEHVGGIVSGADPGSWSQLVEGREMPDRRRRRVLRQDVKGAKETLSRHTYTDVPMPPPFPDAHVTRSDLERLVAGPLAGCADLVLSTLREGGVAQQQLAGVFLVGGSSRIPLVSRLIHERIGVVPTTLDQPETVVARGALRAVHLDWERSAGFQSTGAATVRRYPSGTSGTPSGGIAAPAARARSGSNSAVPGPASSFSPRSVPGDSLSHASTIVMTGSGPTRNVATGRRHRSKAPWLIAAGVALVLVAGSSTTALFVSGGDVGEQTAKRAAQYEYSFDYPSGWERIGGQPRLWETMVGPKGPASNNDLIAVRQGKLDYDVDTERARAVRELRASYQGLVDSGGNYSGFQDSTTFAGRDVVHYREQLPNADVDWFVLHKGHSRVSVGCQYDAPGRAETQRACAQVVGSLKAR